MDILLHRTLLIFDLPPDIVERNKDVIEICIHNMKSQNVEIRYGIHNIKDISGYDLVFLLSHTKNDCFLTADNNTFSFGEFINLLPSSFNGVLETTACFTTSIAPLIRKKCPQCRRIHTFDSSKGLEDALFLLPFIVELFYTCPDLDYQDIYETAKNLLKQTVEENPSNDAKETTKLGDWSKVAIPKDNVMVRDKVYTFHVFVYYQSSNTEKLIKENLKGANSGAEICYRHTLPDLKIGDILEINLFFDRPGINGGGLRKLECTEDRFVEARYDVSVNANFEGNEFFAFVKIKRGNDIIDENCKVRIEVLSCKYEKYIITELYEGLNGLDGLFPRHDRVGTFLTHFTCKGNEGESEDVFLAKYRRILENTLSIDSIKDHINKQLNKLLALKTDSDIEKFRTIVINEYKALFSSINDIATTFEKFKEDIGKINGDNDAENKLLTFLRRINVLDGHVDMIGHFIIIKNLYKEGLLFVAEVINGKGNGRENWQENIKREVKTFYGIAKKRRIGISFFELCKTSHIPGTADFPDDKEVSYPYLALIISVAKGSVINTNEFNNIVFCSTARIESSYSISEKIDTTQASRAKGLIKYLISNSTVRGLVEDYHAGEGKTSILTHFLLKIPM